MKLKISKKIENGSYKVDIEVINFTQEEQSKISKFGSPAISIAPKSILRGYPVSRSISVLPIHSINNTFTFSEEEEADKFVDDMAKRIQEAMDKLRKKEDNFSAQKEYEL